MKALFETAFAKFLEQEGSILASDTAERNWCARLGYHLQDAAAKAGLTGYFADAEYNRNRGKVKTIINGSAEIVQITCDLILHSRATKDEEDNLIAVEMKKTGGDSASKDTDRVRLIALTTAPQNVTIVEDYEYPEHVCGYRLGVYAEFMASESKFILEYYQGGNCFEVTSMPLPKS